MTSPPLSITIPKQITILLLLLSCAATCLSQISEKPVEGQPAHPAVSRGTVLGPDDRMTIWAREVEEISKDGYVVDRSGYVHLPMVGQIRAEGLSVEEFEAALSTSLKKYVREPQVAVTVTGRNSQPVSILGAVVSPGTHQLAGHQTLVEMLTAAGGLRPDAGGRARITRSLDKGPLPVPNAVVDQATRFSVAEVSLRTLFGSEGSEENIQLMPHDVVIVPPAQTVYVIGEVTRQGSIPLVESENMSVLQALSVAGGLTKAAAPQNARILRVVMGGPKRAELPVDLQRIVAGKASDLPLMPSDILFVPDSAGKRVMARAIETGLQVSTSLLTWGLFIH